MLHAGYTYEQDDSGGVHTFRCEHLRGLGNGHLFQYTPEDSIVFGGNFLHSYDIPTRTSTA